MNGSQFGLDSANLARHIKVLMAVVLLQLNLAQAAEPARQGAPAAAASVPQTTVSGAPLQAPKDNIPFDLLQHPSRNPFDAYRGTSVAAPSLENSSRLDSLVRDGKLYLHLQDAIDLALENNLDLVIARYNLPIAQMDILRTSAGGTPRGVNTGVVSGTPGGAGGAFSGSSGAGAGGTSGGAGGAGAGASGLVQSTLGTGTLVNFYDPVISAKTYVDHTTQLLPNQVLYGVPVIHQNTLLGNIAYQQAFPTGGSVQVAWNNNRQTTNSPNNTLNPVLNSYFEFYANQQLLAGFGRGPNLRYLRIAKTNQKVSDIAFSAQLISTVTQICDLYWDLVNAYDNERVGERSVAFATTTLDTSRKQFELQAIPEMDVLKAEADLATRQQDLTIARTNLELQELYMKNVITRSLDDPLLQDLPVIPLDHTGTQVQSANDAVQDLMTYALKNRTEVLESSLVLENSALSRKTARNALLPQLSVYGFYAGTGYAGTANPLQNAAVASSTGFGGAVSNAFNYSSPEYQVGLQLQVPLRNRIAKADQYRTELEYRQSQVYLEELKKRIRIEVRNARFALEQGVGRVSAARKARDLSQRTLNIMQQEQKLGAGSNQQTLSAEHDLALAESALVAAETDYEKARVEMRRAAGSVLEDYGISVAAAKTGVVEEDHSR